MFSQVGLELVNTVLHVGFDSNIQCTVFSEQKLTDDISLYLRLCLKASEVEDWAFITVSIVDSIIRAIKCIKQHGRKHNTEKSRWPGHIPA